MHIAFLRRLAACERGANSIEYAFIACLLGVALIGTYMALGNTVNGHYEEVGTQYAAAANAPRE